MRKSVLSAAVAAAFAVPTIVAAQTPAAAPPPVTGNMTIASDYRFRGISQTYLGPTIQGGIDYAHASGIYLGNWNSNVASIYYYYPNAEWNANTGSTNGAAKFDNWEVYIGGSWKWLSAKLNYALSDYFGLSSEQSAGGYWVNRDTGASLGSTSGSDGTWYFDLSATIPVTKELSVIAHYGKLEVNKYSELDYQDWKLGVTYDLAGWILGAAYIDTNADKNWYYTGGSRGNKATGDSTIVLSVMKTF